jgi:hypothetical protein
VKRSILISLVIALVFSACSSGKTFKTEECKKGQTPDKDNCFILGSRPPTPTKSTPGTKASTKAPTVVQSSKGPPKVSCATYPGKTYTIVIKDVYKKYQPENQNLYRGDYILFKNEDPTNPHSFTVDGTNLDSGILQPGQSKKMRVMLAPKLYKRWHDRQVSYVDGGPLNVTANPRCP